jgi:ribosomal protein L40E
MYEGNLKCAYHPNVKASGKCEKCGKLICLQCKVENYINGVKKEYCKKCDLENQMKTIVNNNSKSCIVMIIIIYVVLIPLTILPIILTNILLSLIPATFLILFTFLFYRHQYHLIPTKRKVINMKIAEFLEKIKEDQLLIICRECGSRIEHSGAICPKCGSNLRE